MRTQLCSVEYLVWLTDFLNYDAAIYATVHSDEVPNGNSRRLSRST